MRSLPNSDCALCPRLSAWRSSLRARHPEWFNQPVPCFGSSRKARLLVLGLAPGERGANRTGRVFTGDGAGMTLYPTMIKFGFAEGVYSPEAYSKKNKDIKLIDAMISNVVRCVPPENKPLPSEIKNCQQFLKGRIKAMTNLKLIIALGHVAHNSLLEALEKNKKQFLFKHGKIHQLDEYILLDSYHCSRRNFSTKILTQRKFDAIFSKARTQLEKSAHAAQRLGGSYSMVSGKKP